MNKEYTFKIPTDKTLVDIITNDEEFRKYFESTLTENLNTALRENDESEVNKILHGDDSSKPIGIIKL